MVGMTTKYLGLQKTGLYQPFQKPLEKRSANLTTHFPQCNKYLKNFNTLPKVQKPLSLLLLTKAAPN